jgi:hypothetical protein
VTNASLKEILRFPFREEDWQSRFLIGIGLLLGGFVIPLVPFVLVAGYTLRVTRQAARGEALRLPPWDDWGALALDGLKVAAINLAYLGPGILIWIVGMGLYFVASFAFPLIIPLLERNDSLMLLFPFLMFGMMAILFLSIALSGLLMILGAIPLPMAKAHFAAQGDLSAAFRVREWWPLLRDHKLDYLIAWVIVAGLFTFWYVGGMLISYTVVLCWVMPLLAMPFGLYLALVSAALFGQTYRQAQEASPQTAE